jgi:formylglycine-generating enzyme required for sulfatase activity
MNGARKIFISYSHKDREWLEKIEPFLESFKQNLFSDQDIDPSTDWKAEIQRAMEESAAAILVVSQNFLASKFIRTNELPQLLSSASERGLSVFPLFVSSCFIKEESSLLRFQGINSPHAPLDTLRQEEQSRVLVRLAQSIDKLVKLNLAGVTDEWLQNFRDRFEMIVGGDFIVGDNALQAKVHALSEHETSVKSIKMARYVVTQSEWKALMTTQPWLNERNVRYGDDMPAVNVSWYDAIDFIRRLNQADSRFRYRLPTETEWEYAARGGGAVPKQPRTRFSFGDDENELISYGWYDQNASLRGETYAHQVGQLAPNPLNLFDMHGNIWEWTADNVDGLRALRGGGFNFGAEGASSPFRVVTKPEFKGEAAGFRVVQDVRAE